MKVIVAAVESSVHSGVFIASTGNILDMIVKLFNMDIDSNEILVNSKECTTADISLTNMDTCFVVDNFIDLYKPGYKYLSFKLDNGVYGYLLVDPVTIIPKFNNTSIQ